MMPMIAFISRRSGRLWIAGIIAVLGALMACGGGSSAEPLDDAAGPRDEPVASVTTVDNQSAEVEATTTGAFRFELPNAAGGTVSLDSYIGEKHVVLVFYRGFW